MNILSSIEKVVPYKLSIIIFYCSNILLVSCLLYYNIVFTLAAGFMSAGGAEDKIGNLFLKLLLYIEIPIVIGIILSFLIAKKYVYKRKLWIVGDIILQLFLGIILGLIVLLNSF